jgi:hypothetical protein
MLQGKVLCSLPLRLERNRTNKLVSMGEYAKRGRSSSSHRSFGLSFGSSKRRPSTPFKGRPSNPSEETTTNTSAAHSPSSGNSIPAIAAFEPAKSPSPSTLTWSDSCPMISPIISDASLQSLTLPDRQDDAKVQDAGKVNGSFVLEDDTSASQTPGRPKPS